MPSFSDAMGAIDTFNNMAKVTSMQQVFRDGFYDSAIDPTIWTSSLASTATVSVASGQLSFSSGTLANGQSYLLSNKTFTIPFRLNLGLTFTLRAGNQTFYVEFVSVNPLTGLPDGVNSAGWSFDGANHGVGKYFVQTGGMAPLVSASQGVIPTSSANPGTYEIELFSDEAWFHSGYLDKTQTRAYSYRAHRQFPDPNVPYKLRFRWLNSASPGSGDTAVLSYLTVQDYAELTAEITAGRGQGTAGQGLGVNLIPGSAQTFSLNTAASTNANSVKAYPGSVVHLSANNASAAAKYIRLYNKASAPTVGTDTPIMVVTVPASSSKEIALDYGMAFSTGIGLAVTGGAGVLDATAVAANDVQLALGYV